MNNQYTLIFPETSVQFINIKSGEVKKDIWHVLKEGNWKNADTINYESNNLKGVLKRDQARERDKERPPSSCRTRLTLRSEG